MIGLLFIVIGIFLFLLSFFEYNWYEGWEKTLTKFWFNMGNLAFWIFILGIIFLIWG